MRMELNQSLQTQTTPGYSSDSSQFLKITWKLWCKLIKAWKYQATAGSWTWLTAILKPLLTSLAEHRVCKASVNYVVTYLQLIYHNVCCCVGLWKYRLSSPIFLSWASLRNSRLQESCIWNPQTAVWCRRLRLNTKAHVSQCRKLYYAKLYERLN